MSRTVRVRFSTRIVRDVRGSSLCGEVKTGIIPLFEMPDHRECPNRNTGDQASHPNQNRTKGQSNRERVVGVNTSQ
jgi:hypothetical protein